MAREGVCGIHSILIGGVTPPIWRMIGGVPREAGQIGGVVIGGVPRPPKAARSQIGGVPRPPKAVGCQIGGVLWPPKAGRSQIGGVPQRVDRRTKGARRCHKSTKSQRKIREYTIKYLKFCACGELTISNS